MTNAEAIIEGLHEIEDDYAAEFVAYYINCPSSPNCKYDGKDSSPCCECKIKWLRSERSD